MNGKPMPLATLAELDEADMFLLVGCNLERSHGVVAHYVRRAALHRRARIVKLNPRHTWLTDWTDVHLQVKHGKDAVVLAAILKYLIDTGKTVAVPPEVAAKLAKVDDDAVPGDGHPRGGHQACGRAVCPGRASHDHLRYRRDPGRHEGLTAAMNLVKARPTGTAPSRAAGG